MIEMVDRVEKAMPDFTILDKCVICGSADITKYLDLGQQVLANSFHDGSVLQTKYPLYLNGCADCGHLQQGISVDPDIMFEDYPYVSGTTATLGSYFDWFVDKVENDFPGRKLRVLEIASNDGSLLKRFMTRGHEVLGVDPARNLLPFAKMNGIQTICGFWGEDIVAEIKDGYWHDGFDVIIAMNVLAHVSEPVPFMRSCRDSLAPRGRIYIQTSQAEMAANGEFDTAYHEHISFFSRTSFIRLADEIGKDGRGDVYVSDSRIVDIHGGSFLYEYLVNTHDYVTPKSPYFDERSSAVYRDKLTKSYEELEISTYQSCEIALILSSLYDNFRPGRQIAYGAAAKGMVYLQRTELCIDCVIDDSPLKQNKLCPGTDVLVVGSEYLKDAVDNLVIWVLAWNFFDEIVAKIKKIRPDNKDIFVTAFPKFRISL